MKLIKENYLKESFGESEELNNFVYLSRYRFNPYYQVTLEMKDNHKSQERYFAFEDAARDYYKKLVDEVKENKAYYGNSTVTLEEVNINSDRDELEDFTSFDEEEE